ncbi:MULTISPECIES: hypothetical protein [unclassified Haladaptatus]|uniref:hypothetical protein n=1 Tax=unclassified Haladaptatus TaxID=2622732 RepID=UPI0023E7CA75|nr:MULTISPECIES: hypothetical protein [unclassified Haladaptatus]
MTASGTTDGDDAYKGVFGAIPYALRASDSLLFRTYVVVGSLAGLLVTITITLALVVLIAATSNVPGGSLTLSRAFYVVIGILVLGPLLAPILFVARRHRRRLPVSARYDTLLAAAGYLFLLSLYVGLVISIPECFVLDGETTCRNSPTGVFGPVISVLYALPAITSPLPPLFAALLIFAIHRKLR